MTAMPFVFLLLLTDARDQGPLLQRTLSGKSFCYHRGRTPMFRQHVDAASGLLECNFDFCCRCKMKNMCRMPLKSFSGGKFARYHS